MANEQWDVAMALARVCQIDLRMATKRQKGMLLQTAKVLRVFGATPGRVDGFGQYWEEADWRGRKGSPPTPAQVRNNWGRYEAWDTDETDELPVYT